MSYLHRRGILAVGVPALALVLVAPCLDVSAKNAAPAPQPRPQNNNNNRNTNTPPKKEMKVLISAVDASAQKVTITDKEKRATTYALDTLTQIIVSGAPGSIKELKAGQEVVNYVERDSATLDLIVVGTP